MGNIQEIAKVCEANAPIISALLGSVGGDANPIHMSGSALGALVPSAWAAEGAVQTALLAPKETIVGGLTEAKVGRVGMEPYAISPGALGQLAANLFHSALPRQSAFGLAA